MNDTTDTLFDQDENETRPTRVARCAYPGCRRLTSWLLCTRHRFELARLDVDDDDPRAEL